MARSVDIKTPLARLSFPNLLKPQTMEQDDGKKIDKYNCVLLFPKSADLSALKDAAVKAAIEEWGDAAKQQIKDGLIKTPFLDGDGPQGMSKKTGQRHAGYEGTNFIRCSTTMQPDVFDRQRQPVLSEKEVYAGCWVYAVVHAYTWSHPKSGKGLSFGITMMQVAKDDEPLGFSKANPDDFFDKLGPEATDGAGKADGDTAESLFG